MRPLAFKFVAGAVACLGFCAAVPVASAPTSMAAGGGGVLTTPGGGPKTMRLKLVGEARSIPRSFFGLSVEANELPTMESAGSVFRRFISLVRPRDGSTMMLRIGGKSTDDAFWKVTPISQPRWVFELTDPWLSQLAAFVKREDLNVMLDLNLPVHAPAMAAQFASAAAASLPHGHLIGLGVGNEPDLYHQQLNLERERVPSTLSSTPQTWAEGYTPAAYQADYRTYAQALLAAVPRIPLVGPDTTSSTPTWIAALSTLPKAGPSMITMHRYAFSTCFKPGSSFYPTIPGLLGQGASAGIAGRLRKALTIATSAGLPLRVTELNSISCGGNEGVANAFVTALWAPDALFELMQSGVAGVNWHVRPQLRNAPFHLVRGGIAPQPELYGLAVFNRMISKGSQLEKLKVSNPGKQNVKAWAVRSGRQLKLLLINKGGEPATVQLDGTGLSRAPARLIRLKAPSLTANTGVSLGGQVIGSDARWHGTQVTESVREAHLGYTFKVRPYSADLIRLSL